MCIQIAIVLIIKATCMLITSKGALKYNLTTVRFRGYTVSGGMWYILLQSPTKMKIFFATNYYVYSIISVCTFCMQLPLGPRLALDPRRLLLDLCCSIICSSLAVAHHEASRLLCRFDHIPWSRSYSIPVLIFNWRSRADSESGFVRLLSFSSVLWAVPTVLMHKVTYKVWSILNFHGWLHPWKLNTRKFLRTKYFKHKIFAIYSMFR